MYDKFGPVNPLPPGLSTAAVDRGPIYSKDEVERQKKMQAQYERQERISSLFYSMQNVETMRLQMVNADFGDIADLLEPVIFRLNERWLALRQKG